MAGAARFNLAAALLDRHLDGARADAPAIRFEGRTLTYGELARLVARAGNALRELGVRPGERVALVLPDSPEFLAMFLGAVRIGAVPLPLSTLLTPSEYAYMLADSAASIVVAAPALAAAVAPARRELPAPRHVVVAGETEGRALELQALLDAASHELAPAATNEDDMCFWQYSSGTTGRPKAVIHRQRDLWEVTERYGRHVIGMSAADRSYSVPKLFFSYGLGNSLAFPLRYGATVVLDPGRPDARRAYDLLAGERPSLFYAVPTFYASMLAIPEREAPPEALSSVRHCVSAGEALPKAIFTRWKERFAREILDGIGSTEVGYIFISNRPGRVRPGTSGELVSGYEARIIDDDGADAAPGESGTLLVRGPSIFSGYWAQPERTARTLVDGWVVTGDRYTLDRDGYFTYHGRQDDMLRVGAMWVSPAEVEGALLEHRAVAECAVVGAEDADGLTKPLAYVVLRDAAASPRLADELRAFARERLAGFKVPRWIAFAADLPKTPTGKVRRHVLRERARERDREPA